MCPPGQGCVLYGARTSLKICRAGGTKSAGTACTAAVRMPQRRMLRPRLPRQRWPEPRLLLRRLPGEQRLRARSGLRPAGRRQQRLGRRPARRPGRRLLPHAVRADRRRRAAAPTPSASRARTARTPATSRTASATARRPRPGPPAAARPTARSTASAASARASKAGYCQTFGCDQAATTGVNACPGTNSICAQRGGPDEPISACYEKCMPTGAACSRASGRLQVRIDRRRSRRPASAW